MFYVLNSIQRLPELWSTVCRRKEMLVQCMGPGEELTAGSPSLLMTPQVEEVPGGARWDHLGRISHAFY